MTNLKTLYDKAQENSAWLKLQDNESFEGKFIGVEEATGFKGKETNEFTFLSVGGKQKSLQTSSFSLLASMMSVGVEEGDMVKITRHGLGTETKYTAELIEKKKK